MKKLARKFLRRYIDNPEIVLGFPPHGIFWSSLGPIGQNYSQSKRSIELAREMLEIGIRSLNRDLSHMLRKSENSVDREVITSTFGEHYKFLEELSYSMQPNLAIEIGTHRGLGTLALSKYSKKTITFDIVPWKQFNGTLLRESDFCAIEQKVTDLSLKGEWDKNINSFRNADIVFLDGPKNGKFEEIILPLLLQNMKRNSILIIDDIRFLNMIGLWKSIEMPKFDATSFAHYSGTGVVRIL